MCWTGFNEGEKRSQKEQCLNVGHPIFLYVQNYVVKDHQTNLFIEQMTLFS